jgi:hypothetical protein
MRRASENVPLVRRHVSASEFVDDAGMQMGSRRGADRSIAGYDQFALWEF